MGKVATPKNGTKRGKVPELVGRNRWETFWRACHNKLAWLTRQKVTWWEFVLPLDDIYLLSHWTLLSCTINHSLQVRYGAIKWQWYKGTTCWLDISANWTSCSTYSLVTRPQHSVPIVMLVRKPGEKMFVVVVSPRAMNMLANLIGVRVVEIELYGVTKIRWNLQNMLVYSEHNVPTRFHTTFGVGSPSATQGMTTVCIGSSW